MGASGQGSISAAPKPSSSGVPFPGNAAVNGLSVNGSGQIVIGNNVGGNAAVLLSDRQIPMAGFSFGFKDGVKETVFYPAGVGTHVFTTDDVDGQLLVLNGHNNSAGTSAFMSMALFSDTNQAMQVIQTNSNYTAGFPSNAGMCYASGVNPEMWFITDSGGNIFFAAGDNTAAGLKFSMWNSGNVRIGGSKTDPSVKLQVDGEIKFEQLAPLTAPTVPFRFGSVVAGASVLDATRFVEVVINGTLIKLAVAA